MTAETETGEALSGAGMPRPPDTERDEARLPLELPRVDVVWGLPRCVWARESTAPAQGNQSLCGARGGFLPRHDEDLREPLVRRQGSQEGKSPVPP